MFDLLEWRWDYEPFDLDGWIPDFILHGESPTLVEVKPIPSINYHASLDDELAKHAEASEYEILLLGLGPNIPGEGLIGWHFEYEDIDDGPSLVSGPASFMYISNDKPHDKHAEWDWCSAIHDFRGRITGWYDACIPEADPLVLTSMWRQAGNRVQWNPTPKPNR
jgi:hypothetical protein